MSQFVIAMNFTSWGMEFTSPIIDIYAPWATVGVALIVAGIIGTVYAIRQIRSNK